MSSRKPLPLRLSPKARQDFIDILRYTGETWGETQLQRYRRAIDGALQSIRLSPARGHGRSDLPHDCLAYTVGSHIIVYRIDAAGVGVIRILHQRMSLGRHV